MPTSDSSTTKTTKATSAARTSRRPAAKRKPAAKPAKSAPRGATARSATTATAASSTPVGQAQQLAQRAVLIPVGAALEARDRVAGAIDEIVATTRSRRAFDERLARFERRGGHARTQLEREVRRTRTRLEREARNARRGFDRQRAEARKGLGANVDTIQSRVESLVQNGVSAGITLVNGVQERIAKIA